MEIRYLKNREINFVRWDNCINNAINGSVFAYSWYLNILCEEWEALVLDDYLYVMPLLHRTELKQDIFFTSKLGIRLGIFSNQLLTENIVIKFIESIPSKNSFVNISLNLFNKLNTKDSKSISTFELDLIQSYKKITEKYSPQFRKDLQIAKTGKVTFGEGLLPNDLINFSIRQNARSNPKLNKIEIKKLRMIIAHSLRYGLGEIYCAYTKSNNLCASAFFLKSKRKLHLLYAAIDKIGISLNAFHLLIDKYIEVHSEKDLTLNLENVISNNNIDFFSGVGAHEYQFHQYHSNSIPWIYKLLIKKY